MTSISHISIIDLIFFKSEYYTLNNICSIEETLQYNHHATPGEPCKVLLGLHGDCTEGFFLKNLYCLECTSCESRLSEWKFQLNNLAVKGLTLKVIIASISVFTLFIWHQTRQFEGEIGIDFARLMYAFIQLVHKLVIVLWVAIARHNLKGGNKII